MSRASSSRDHFFVVRFIKDVPVWERFDGHTLRPAQPPRSSRSLPVLALVPDRLFFFFQPESDRHSGSLRQRTAAARLELEQMFPGGMSGNGSTVLLDAGRNHLMGCLPHPELADFSRRHQDLLRRANAVTTPFFLAWNAGLQQKAGDWIWTSPEDEITAAMHAGNVTFFPGNDAELEARLPRNRATDLPNQPPGTPKAWSLTELLQAAPNIGWSRLRLPLPSAVGEGSDLRRLLRLWVAVAILGGLICFGQALRLTAQQTRTGQWEQATNRLYAEVLPPPLGEDPFGRLIFRHGQLQSPVQAGPDPLAMLGLLSASAPDGFHVENFSLGSNSGIIRVKLADYEQLEALLKALEGQNQLRFELDQASSAENAILATLRVNY